MVRVYTNIADGDESSFPFMVIAYLQRCSRAYDTVRDFVYVCVVM